eukprot:Gregarina_sp_Pseudo_9__1522@NODE_2021_length_1198_cov_136_791199_g1866_i0_p1_GENE_NODE_2021_length_1198_cov_136_791199_g1866_i0NODE_2021_length_1198_cov_136_791199_g1866_i0_p1_ORF_typecomplete_len344_score46_09Aldo_ket_red/PF00248_21/7_7e41AP_endonuc_2/PF01261_24/6_8AP_endonuc_2/PF01261_24/25_NODE_2021_length_1198_cov_136_791199_g1866_i01181149
MKVLVRELPNGVLMPAVGLGSYECKEDSSDVILSAFQYGYKKVDTADFYENYPAVRSALERFEQNFTGTTECPVAQKVCAPKGFKVVEEEEFLANFKIPHGNTCYDGHRVFVTTKTWPKLSAEKIRETVERFMKECNRTQLDMLVLHWPGPLTYFGCPESDMKNPENAAHRLDAWKEMERQYAAGRIRALGVSNFMLQHLQPLVEDIKKRQAAGDKLAMLPMMNQIEISPWILPDKELEAYSEEVGILLESYSPMGSGSRVQQCMGDPVIVEMASKYKKSPALIILRSMLDRGYIIIPKSSNPKRVIANYDLFDFAISDEDLEYMADRLDKQIRTWPDPNLIV